MRILVLDDNQEALLVVERFLKTLGHQVFAFTEGMEALLWLKDAAPQVFLVDLDMPGMDGFEFLRRLRAFQTHAATPAVCITGTEATDEDIMSAGFCGVLRKPVTLSDLMTAIDELETGTPQAQP
jgi:two-component system CheB/CheR fusion protein